MADIGPGTIVKCVDDSRWTGRGYGYGDESFPIAGAIYQVRSVSRCACGSEHLLLCEIANPVRKYACSVCVRSRECEYEFGVSRFVPLDDSRLEVFRKALTNIPESVDA